MFSEHPVKNLLVIRFTRSAKMDPFSLYRGASEGLLVSSDGVMVRMDGGLQQTSFQGGEEGPMKTRITAPGTFARLPRKRILISDSHVSHKPRSVYFFCVQIHVQCVLIAK